MKKTAFLLCLTFATSAFALLPPLAQSTREIQTLLADSHLQEWLGSAEQIKDIIRTDSGYMVLTQKKLMQVDVHYLPSQAGFAGPAQFRLEFHPPVDRRVASASRAEMDS